ncbi:prepilin peptidase [Fluviispira multicolorata]|uniref:Prepilin leader peptidase/N-methyltransferase n=1 Tax=Fluviispira multicolorata TaxID=2654512 RepID=A0A833JEY8_9BACT|nr:A24 family peptidase [Fluviispira multicolorata]KAB8030745.1 prepilin peptidase [Fluviispira multicolorata]
MPIELNTLNIIFGLFVFIFGICIGSFLNVVIYRLPNKISLILPRSSCPSCKTIISPFALIPLLGYIFTRGKCQKCKTKISIQYPFVEFLCGILSVIVFFKFLNPYIILDSFPILFSVDFTHFGRFHYSGYVPFFVSLWLLYTGIPLSFIDLKYKILPNSITLPGILVGFAMSCLNPDLGWLESLIGIACGAGGLFFISKFYEYFRKKEGMGMGDIKYLGFIGAVLGWKGVILTLFMASFIAAIIGIIWAIYSKKGLSAAIPFGPFLATSAFIISVFGNDMNAYIYFG